MCTIASERANARRILAISVKDILLHSSLISLIPLIPPVFHFSTRSQKYFYSQSETFLFAVRKPSARSQKQSSSLKKIMDNIDKDCSLKQNGIAKKLVCLAKEFYIAQSDKMCL